MQKKLSLRRGRPEKYRRSPPDPLRLIQAHKRGFQDLPPREGILNPGHKLEWERFQQKIAADFLSWQAAIIRELKRPDQFVSHDFAGIPTDVDLYEITKALDIPSVNIYHGMQDSLTGEEIAYMGAFVRSLKPSNYLVTETNAQTILNQFSRMLYNLNVEADFLYPQSRNFEGYSLVIVPPLYIAPDELLEQLLAYVKNGGHILMAFKSGFCNENPTVRWRLAPGPLREAAGFYYQEFSNLAKPLALKGDPFKAGPENQVSVWAEFLIPEKAKPLAYYDHPFFGRYPAVTRNAFGKGTLTYEGTRLSDTLQEKLVRETLALAGVSLSDSLLPAPVKVKHAKSAAGEPLHFYFNFSGQPQTFIYGYENGIDILTGQAIKKAEKITLAPRDFIIVKVR